MAEIVPSRTPAATPRIRRVVRFKVLSYRINDEKRHDSRELRGQRVFQNQTRSSLLGATAILGDSITGVDTTLTSQIDFDERYVHSEAAPIRTSSIQPVHADRCDPERKVVACGIDFDEYDRFLNGSSAKSVFSINSNWPKGVDNAILHGLACVRPTGASQ